MSVQAKVDELKNAVAEFETEYARYTEKNVNSAGSKSRKALMGAKKAINALRKEILLDQKSKKAAKKATKGEETKEEKKEE